MYVEAYGLAFENGRTNYEIEAVLCPVDDAGLITRTFGRLLDRRPPAAVSVQFAISGTASDDIGWAEQDVTVGADFDTNEDSAIWYGFSDTFLNGLVVPGAQIVVKLAPGCALDSPPDFPGDGVGFC